MRLNERLVSLADLWAMTNERSTARLATIVANDGKMIERLRGGAGCTVAVAERFFDFFRAEANWRDARVPERVGELLDGVDLGIAVNHGTGDTAAIGAASPGNVGEVTGAAA